MNSKKTKGKSMALSQILTLLVGTIAFAYMIGQIGFVGAYFAPPSAAPTPVHPGAIYEGLKAQLEGSSAAGSNAAAATTAAASAANPVLSSTTIDGVPLLGQIPGNVIKGITQFFGANEAAATTIANGVIGIASAAAYAYAVYTAFDLLQSQVLHIAPGAGLTAYRAAQYAATGGVAGYFAAGTLNTIGSALGLGTLSVGAWTGIGIGIALIVWALTYSKNKVNAAVLQCLPWQAPTGGNDCDKCGQNGLPCTAYQCASLGQSCKLENANSGEPLCVWVDKGDIVPPVISFLNVLPGGYTYSPLTAASPGDTGVLVQSGKSNGEIPPYSILTIGIKTDKASECKVDTVRGDSYDTMKYTMSADGGIDGTEGLWGYNHTMSIPILQNSNSNGASATTSGQVDLYIRCQNANGKSSPAAFDVEFVVDTAPDTTPPQIVGESIQSGSPIPSGTTSTTVSVYTNKPVSGCKWSHNNGYGYSDMENNMTCPNTLNMQGAFAGTFSCAANLTGLKSNQENDFYFACQDLSGNVDMQSTPYSLIGTQPLIISSVTPANGTTIKDSTQSVKATLTVQTSAGQNQGQATCYYDPSSDPAGYKQFSGPSSYQNSQDLWLSSGAYNYNIKCVDAGGNAAYTSVNFNVETDTQPPNVVRASHDGANLNIQTNEQSTCVYDIVDCTYPFDGGTSMSSADGVTFSTAWVAGRTYYIKCQDSFGNAPAPNSCSIILSPSSV